MRSLRLFLVSLLMVGCGPIVMIPGGELSGEVQPIPSSWAFTDDVETFQLETRQEDPYSVNIWAIHIDGAMFVVAGGGPKTTWAQHIAMDPRVRLRAGDALYELSAAEANSPSDRDDFLAAAKKKYDFDPEGEETSKAILYRLEPR